MNIKRTIWGAFGYVFEYRKPLVKALFIPIILLILTEALSSQDGGYALIISMTVISFIAYTILAITTHRIILLGPGLVSPWGMNIPSKRELRFFMYSIGLGLLIIPFGLLSLIPNVGWVIGLMAIFYVISRLSLVFPAIATDHDWTFTDSWNATREHQFHMLVVVAIFPFLIGIPEQLLSNLPFMGVIVNILSALTLVFVIAALSVAFQVIIQADEESNQVS